MKIRRARKEQRELLIHKETTPLLAIFFDGRKDKTLLYKKNEEYEHFKRSTVLEEHITILQEPSSNYLGHVTTDKNTAKEVKKSILNFLSTKYETKDLIAIGCDGTVINTGYKIGVIRLIEEELGRPLQSVT
jgi:hypothetical protein